MVRHVLIRNPSGDDQIVPETPLPAEKNLHDVLTSHPELLPADNLEVGQTIVVGRESKLESGYADLVLVDAYGQICLVEVKNEGNPDTRLVIAQLLDYAAALWQMPVDNFEHDVLHPYLRSIDQHEASLPDIASYVADNLEDTPGDVDAGDDEDTQSTLTDFPVNLEQTLASGHFRLIVAAPSIPTGIEKVIEYLNAQGHLIYGLEVSFFGGAAECFVPNLVVKPRVSETKRIAARKPTPIDEATLAERLPARVNPDDPFLAAREAVQSLGVGGLGSDGWQYSIKWDESTDEQINDAFDTAITLLAQLIPEVEFQPLEPHLIVDFGRNDNNIWSKSAPALNPYVGYWLQGTLAAIEGPNAPVRLQPLRGGQPGWQPRFDSPSTAETIWPANLHTGKFQLVLTHTAEEAHSSP